MQLNARSRRALGLPWLSQDRQPFGEIRNDTPVRRNDETDHAIGQAFALCKEATPALDPFGRQQAHLIE